MRITKKELRNVVRDVAFCKLAESMRRSTKIKDIRYAKLEIQSYLKSNSLCQEEICMLTAIRSKCVRGIKHNFRSQFKQCTHCPLKCNSEQAQEDTQEHILVCTKLSGSRLECDFAYTEGVQQSQLAQEFSRLMRQRTTMLEEEATSSCCLPGALFLDPSTDSGAPVTNL